MIERGEIDFEDVAGYERKRAEYIHLFKDVITDADFYYNDSNGPNCIREKIRWR